MRGFQSAIHNRMNGIIAFFIMVLSVSVLALVPTADRKRRVPKKLHSFFVGFTIVFALLVLAGFNFWSKN